MKASLTIICATFLLVASSTLFPTPAAAKSPSPSPAKAQVLPADAAGVVNGEILPQRIVDAFIQNGVEALGIVANDDEGRKKLANLREAIIDEQIGRFLIAQEAERRKIAPSEAEIDAVENRTIESMNSEERYSEFLKKNNFSREDYRRYVIHSELCGKAMAAALGEGISASEGEIRKYYEAHKGDADFQWPERVQVAHIMLDTRRGVLNERVKREKQLADGPELKAAVDAEIGRREQLAEEIRKEALQPGADFGALAAKYSDDLGSRNKGGNLGMAAKGVRPFDEVTFSLQPGEIGPVMKTDFGSHVIKVLDHRPAETRPLDERAPEIRQRLIRQKQTKKMREWLEQARRKAKIVVRPAEAASQAATRP